MSSSFPPTSPNSSPVSKYVSEVTQSCLTLQPHRLQPARLLHPWDSPGKNTGADCRSLLQRIFPNQGLNPGLQHCRQILYCLGYREVPLSYLVVKLSGHFNYIGTHELYSPWNSPDQNTGVGSFSLLQGILPNPGLLHCRWVPIGLKKLIKIIKKRK